MTDARNWPVDEAQLEALLTEPSEADVEAASKLRGDLIVLGAGGKMGPSLVIRARQALDRAGSGVKVKAVVRQDRGELRGRLARHGVELIEADLLDPDCVRGLAGAATVVFMVGRKFGSSEDESLTWATNAWGAGLLAHHYRRSKIVVFSTGNVYPFVNAQSNGATEKTRVGPVGPYAQSTLARERIFEYFANRHGTKVLLFRLNYANDLRYGVLTDIGMKVFLRRPIDLNVGFVNVIWQGDANSYCLRAFDLCSAPARALNVTGDKISVRAIAQRFGELFQIEPVFEGREGPTALLSDASVCWRQLGPPSVGADEMVKMVAHWIKQGGVILDKPTKFERNDGSF